MNRLEQTVGKDTLEAAKTQAPVIVRGYKGFDKDLRCRDMQYDVGKTYAEPEALLYQKGLHFCQHPLDVWNYYSPQKVSRYCAVDAKNPTLMLHMDSTRVSKKLTIVAELSLESLIKAAVKFVQECATAGKNAHAATTGKCANAATTGHYSYAATTGYYSNAATTGKNAHAAATGKCANAATTGKFAHAATTGYVAHAVTTGKFAHAATTGDTTHAFTTGYAANAVAAGSDAHAATTGKYAHAATTGNTTHAFTTGYAANAVATGDGAHAVAIGDASVAFAAGRNGRAKAKTGSWIVLTERDEQKKILCVRAAQIDGEILKPHTYYMLVDGEFIEADE